MHEPFHPLPASPDDPRLNGWYHTIDLAPGITTHGFFDHRSIAREVGLPESLEGKTALDVGTAEGFWALEMERRGARVTAIDIPNHGAFDLTPPARASAPAEQLNMTILQQHFATAHAMRDSKINYRFCSVYDLSPETVGMFDVVYCGSLLLHLFNPLQALINIRRVTREMAIIETASNPGFDAINPELCLATFGNIAPEGQPGEHTTYWIVAPQTLVKMLDYAGFSRVESRGLLKMSQTPPPGYMWVTSAVAYV